MAIGVHVCYFRSWMLLLKIQFSDGRKRKIHLLRKPHRYKSVAFRGYFWKSTLFSNFNKYHKLLKSIIKSNLGRFGSDKNWDLQTFCHQIRLSRRENISEDFFGTTTSWLQGKALEGNLELTIIGKFKVKVKLFQSISILDFFYYFFIPLMPWFIMWVYKKCATHSNFSNPSV